MSEMAAVSMEGVGLAYDAAKSFPVTWVDVEKVPLESSTVEKPVRKVAAAGLSPMSPATQFPNCGGGDVSHFCLGEDCEISSRAQVNGWRSGGIDAVRDGEEAESNDGDGRRHGLLEVGDWSVH